MTYQYVFAAFLFPRELRHPSKISVGDLNQFKTAIANLQDLFERVMNQYSNRALIELMTASRAFCNIV
jgi:hypothetical protein